MACLQSIISTNDVLLLIRSLATNLSKIYSKCKYLYSENQFENVVWEMAAILSQPQCVSGLQYKWEGLHV